MSIHQFVVNRYIIMMLFPPSTETSSLSPTKLCIYTAILFDLFVFNLLNIINVCAGLRPLSLTSATYTTQLLDTIFSNDLDLFPCGHCWYCRCLKHYYILPSLRQTLLDLPFFHYGNTNGFPCFCQETFYLLRGSCKNRSWIWSDGW